MKCKSSSLLFHTGAGLNISLHPGTLGFVSMFDVPVNTVSSMSGRLPVILGSTNQRIK